MTIRDHDDGISRVTLQERDYFNLQDNKLTHLNFNRFLFMPVGSKSKFFDWRLDWEKKEFPFTTFLIDHEKFVNRPESISFEVYGNPKHWWIIAMANDITDPFIGFTKGKKLKIPDLDLVKRAFGM